MKCTSKYICISFLICLTFANSVKSQDSINIERISSVYDWRYLTQEVVTYRELALFSVTRSNVRIVDVEDPSNPRELGFSDVGGIGSGLALQNNLLYVATNDSWDEDSGHLRIFEITDQNEVLQVGYLSLGDYVRDIEVSDNYAYVAMRVTGVAIIDISDPEEPRLAQTLRRDGEFKGVAIDGNFLYIAAGNVGCYVANVTDPPNSWIIESFDTPGTATKLTCVDSVLYVADRHDGLHLYDASDPENIEHLSTYRVIGRAYDVTVVGDHAFIAYAYGGLRVLDVSDSEHPNEVGYYITSNQADEVYVSDNLVYICEGDYFEIFSCEAALDVSLLDPTYPSDLVLGAPYPNPFNSVVTIPYQLSTTSSATLSIFNTNGREVTTLVNRQTQAGYHQTTWDAINQPTGVYFFQLETTDFVGTTKLVLVK